MTGSLFFVAILGYGLGTALYAVGLTVDKPSAVIAGFRVVLLSSAAHTGVVVLHLIASQRLPVGNFEGGDVGAAWDDPLSTIAWLLVLALAVLGSLRPGMRVIGAFVLPIALGLMLSGLLSASGGAMADFLPDALDSAWQPVHSLSVYLSFALFALAFGSGVVYLLQHLRLKRKTLPPQDGSGVRLPSLEVLDRLNHRGFVAGLVLLTAGIVSGTFWAISGAGAGADLRPKVGITLALWLLYALSWQARSLMGWGGRKAAWLAIIGFIGVLVSVLGVQHG